MEKKLYQICSSIPPSNDAVGEFAYKLNKLLVKKGVDSLILTNRSGDGAESFFNKFKLVEIIKVVRYLLSENCNLVIIHFPGLLFKRNVSINFLPLILRFFRINSIIYLHEYDSYSKLGKLRIFPMLYFSNHVITTDTVNYELLNSFLFRDRLSLLPAGSNLYDEFFYSLNHYNDQSFSDKKFKLLYFGLLMEGKGLEIILDFFSKKSFFFEKIEFHIIGGLPHIVKNSDLRLHEKINQIKSVKYHGFVKNEDLPMMFNLMDIVILPFEKGLTERRTSFMTAAGFGKLVLTTKGQCEIEGLRHEENIMYLKNLSETEIEKALSQLLELDSLQIKLMGNKLKEWYFNNYSDRLLISKFLEIIKK